jgi:flagellar biosynthetic protein FliQ
MDELFEDAERGQRSDQFNVRLTPHPSRAALADNTQGRVARMELSAATDLVRQALTLALIVSAPMLLIGLAVGIVVSLMQAVTQIQEQTLTFVPKITAMIAAAIILLPWIGQRLMDYSAYIFSGH